MAGPATDSPPPWRVEHDGDVMDVDHGPEVSWPWRIVDVRGQVIVDIQGGEDVSEQVARLLAAAPDLLNALDRFLGDVCECDAAGVTRPCAYCEGWAAYRKATDCRP